MGVHRETPFMIDALGLGGLPPVGALLVWRPVGSLRVGWWCVSVCKVAAAGSGCARKLSLVVFDCQVTRAGQSCRLDYQGGKYRHGSNADHTSNNR